MGGCECTCDPGNYFNEPLIYARALLYSGGGGANETSLKPNGFSMDVGTVRVNENPMPMCNISNNCGSLNQINKLITSESDKIRYFHA